MMRSCGHPIAMIGFKKLPDLFIAGLVNFSWGYGWLALSGTINGVSIYSLNTALKLGQLLTVAPIVACSPAFTMLMGLLIFKRETITWSMVLSVAPVVSGVIVVVIQS
jgi:uncharacterized membrane protein